MIGPRIGSRIGSKRGPAIGVGLDELSGAAALAPQDGPSSWYVPATAGHFTALGITVPDSLWLCQEAAGNLADSIGALVLTAAGAPSYQQNLPAGWTRKGVGGASAAGKRFAAAAGVGPNPGATSVAWLFYVQLTAIPGGARSIVLGSDNAVNLEHRVSAVPRNRCTCATLDGDGVNDPGTALVRPVYLMYNRAAGTVMVYTDQEKIAGTYSAIVADGNKGIGASAIACAAFLAGWGCLWSGANAELTDAQVKTRLQALNITIPWS